MELKEQLARQETAKDQQAELARRRKKKPGESRASHEPPLPRIRTTICEGGVEVDVNSNVSQSSIPAEVSIIHQCLDNIPSSLERIDSQIDFSSEEGENNQLTVRDNFINDNLDYARDYC